MSKRRSWEEVFLQGDDHAIRVVTELIRTGTEFDVKPVPGWWRVRAATTRTDRVPHPLVDIVSSRVIR